jgi:hypothetical protein
MPTYLTQEEIRMRVLEGEVEGEKAMTHYILRQRQHGDELILARSKLERKRGSIVCGEIALMSGVRPFGVARRAGTGRRSVAPGAGERRRHMDKMRADIDTTCLTWTRCARAQPRSARPLRHLGRGQAPEG